jgi:hypothetical protein
MLNFVVIRNCNDGFDLAPRLRIDLNRGNLWELPKWSVGPKLDDPDHLLKLKAAGFEGVQGWNRIEAEAAGLGVTTAGRVNLPGEIEPLTRQWKEEGFDCSTLHVGWGTESDDEIDALVSEIIEASTKHDFPLYIETHRATIAQDNWRTVQICHRFPEVRFNGDFSHFYTGHEMPYGDFDAKLAFLQPVLERTKFMHGRIGNSSHMQIRWSDPTMPGALAHFRKIWVQVFRSFLADGKPGDFFCFTPEIIPFSINYARQFEMPDGTLVEESDRYMDALQMVSFAKECWSEAQSS